MIIGLDASRANVLQRTGTERYAWEVIRRLVLTVPDHQVRLYVREPLLSDWPSLPNNVEVRVLTWRVGILWTHLRLSWELLLHRPDLLFVPADTVPLIHPKKTVTTIHDIAFERFPELYRHASVQRKMGWLRPFVQIAIRVFTLGRYGASERDYHRWSVRQAVRTCPTILTVSEFTKQELVDVLKIAPDRIHVTYLGVDQPEHYSRSTEAEQSAVLRRLNIERPYFLYIGRLEKKKNITKLIASYQKYISDNPLGHDLVLVGNPGYGWEEAQPLLQNPVMQSHVHVLGWTPDHDLDILRVRAAAFVFISNYEGFGLPVLDALSAGVPVIASTKGSLPEVLGSDALLVDPDDTSGIVSVMVRITTDQALRHRLQQSGRDRVRRFTWDKTAEATRQVLLS